MITIMFGIAGAALFFAYVDHLKERLADRLFVALARRYGIFAPAAKLVGAWAALPWDQRAIETLSDFLFAPLVGIGWLLRSDRRRSVLRFAVIQRFQALFGHGVLTHAQALLVGQRLDRWAQR